MDYPHEKCDCVILAAADQGAWVDLLDGFVRQHNGSRGEWFKRRARLPRAAVPHARIASAGISENDF